MRKPEVPSRLGTFLLAWIYPFVLVVGLVASIWGCWYTMYRLPHTYSTLEDRGVPVTGQPVYRESGDRDFVVVTFTYRGRTREERVFDSIDQFRYSSAGTLEQVPVLVDPEDAGTAFTVYDVRERTNTGLSFFPIFVICGLIFCVVSLIKEIPEARQYVRLMSRDVPDGTWKPLPLEAPPPRPRKPLGEPDARQAAWLAQGRRRRWAQAVAWVVVPSAIVVALTGTGAGSEDSGHDPPSKPTGSSPLARKLGYPARTSPAPPWRISRFNLDAAAKAAGCRLRRMPLEGRHPPELIGGEPVPSLSGPRHVKGKVDYKSDPPTSGEHSAVWAPDGNYAGRRSPAPEKYVHSLERGRIVVHYKPGTPPRTISRLQNVLIERTWAEAIGYLPDGSFALLLENATGMRYAVAATAWRELLGCPTFNDRVFDAIRAFRTANTLRGPKKALKIS